MDALNLLKSRILEQSPNIDDILSIIEKVQAELSYYRAMYDQFVKNGTVGMYILEERTFSYVNERFCEMIGYTSEELCNGSISLDDIVHPSDIKIVNENIQKRLEQEVENISYQIRAIRKDGNVVYLDVHGSKVVIDGSVKIVGTVSDITEQVLNKQKLQASEQSFRSLFDYNPDAVYKMDMDGKFLAVNQACETISGYSVEELLKTSFAPLISPEDLPIALYHLEEAKKGNVQNYEITILHKSGKKVYLHVTNFPMIVNGTMVGVYGIAKDITNRVIYEKQIKKLAFYDTLTNLPNRRMFKERLQLIIENSKITGQPFAVFYLDLDRFKYINDSFGHHVGDEFLRQVSERLLGCIRKIDTLARLGGDEFALVLPEITEAEASTIAEKILEALKIPFTIQGQSVVVSASIGITFGNGQNAQVDEYIRKADLAMYYSKKKGRNNYQIFDDELNSLVSYKRAIEDCLKQALEQNEFQLHYQPIFDLQTKEIAAAEVLIRWNHPRLGFVPPMDFIPIAEESGQINEIGKWIINSACRQLREWKKQELPLLKLAFNISPKQLQHPQFVETIKEIIEETGVGPQWLEIEITEDALMEVGESGWKESLLQLKEMGVSVSIDDFGSGDISLNHLRQFVFDKVKIDRSLINDINYEPSSKTIVTAIISLAHSLNITAVAKGIETESQLAYLQKQECHQGQGNFFSRPLSSDELIKRLRATGNI
jgi:diguanylate cyclase (GGDEF)-like protein/PAS domain S-box-containing protein